MGEKHYWLSDTFSTPADDLCLHRAPSPDADFRCIRPNGHAGKHHRVWSPDIRHYSHKEVCKQCGATPIREVLDGEPLCQSCCNIWVQGEAPETAGRTLDGVTHDGLPV